MPLQSDITINLAKFDPITVPETATRLNEELLAVDRTGVRWWEVGAPKYREMRTKGETSLFKPMILPEGQDLKIPSRESSRSIPCRAFHAASQRSNGSILHIHGGGWVLMSEKSSDPLLKFYADISDCTVISVGYRLAPEHPFPAGIDDCFDAADYLHKNSPSLYGGPLRLMGGESAGGHLSALTVFHLLRTYPTTPAPSLLLHFGAYDLTHLPQAYNISDPPLLDMEKMVHFLAAFCPGMSVEDRKSPKVSPFYEDLEKFRSRLPRALFTCGTADCLLDDTVMMGLKWSMAGGQAIVKIYPGLPHGFLLQLTEETKKAMRDTREFILDCLEPEQVSQ